MLTRRRFLTIAASAAALPLAPGGGFAAPVPEQVVWRGVAMGALASMTLIHRDREAGKRLIARSVAEIARLEAIFRLFRPDSALSQLNRAGHLDNPPLELVELLAFSTLLARRTGGAFDPTVQPLFELYAAHFSRTGAHPAGPASRDIDAVLARVDHRAVEIASDRIRLTRSGMGITLNGIAQGYVTDRVASLLRAEGLENMLLDLGEIAAHGQHPEGRPWRAAVRDPARRADTLHDVELGRADGLTALATSGGYGYHFDPAGRHHHLFDPATGRSAGHYASVSVVAPDALTADGLSTALSALPPTRAAAVLAEYGPARAFLVGEAGSAMQLATN
jgi:FAD:protein FMN transferase